MLRSIKVKTRKEISQEYGVTQKTFRAWLKREGIELPRGVISPKNQIKIYNKLDLPKVII